jgi:hypothetical protein
MPNDPRPALPAAPELAIDEVRDLARRAAKEVAIDKDRAYVQIRSSYALLKRADELLARR